MKPTLVASLLAIVLIGAGVGTYFAVAGAGSGEEAPAAQATPTPTPAEQTSATPALPPRPTTAETLQSGDWTTYVDPELGFSFPCRSDWTISTDYYDLPARKGNPAVRLRSVTFHNPEGAQTIAFGVTPNPADLTLEDWVASYPGWPSEPVSLTVAGQRALLFPINVMGERFPAIYFKYGRFVISLDGNIYGSGGGALPPGINQAEFEFILENFRFGK